MTAVGRTMLLYKSNNKLLFQVVFFIIAVLEILLLSGITYGWASIEFVFQREGFFDYLCLAKSQEAVNLTGADSSFHGNLSTRDNVAFNGGCSRKSTMFNLVFNVSLFFLCTTKFPIGLFVDAFGPRAGQLSGCFLYLIAGFGLAFVTKETSGLLFPIFIFFCVGGGFIAVAKYQMCRFIYTDVRSLALSILHGTFDSSAVILLFFKLAWESGFKLRDISLFYIILSLVMIALSLVLLTPPYKTLLHDWSEEQKPVEPESHGCANGGTSVDVKIYTFERKPSQNSLLKTIFSPQYLLELMFLSFCQLRLWFFIGSLNELIALYYPGDEASVDAYNTYFGYAQLCGILVGPLIGFIFDRNSVKCKREQNPVDEKPLINTTSYRRIGRIQESVLPFVLTNFLCLGFSVLSLTPWRHGLIPSFVLHVLTRGFLYSAHASYIALAFQPQRFATLYGLGIFASGMFGLLEYPLYNIVFNWFNSDPFWINVALLILVFVANIFPLNLMYYCQKMKSFNARPVGFKNGTVSWHT